MARLVRVENTVTGNPLGCARGLHIQSSRPLPYAAARYDMCAPISNSKTTSKEQQNTNKHMLHHQAETNHMRIDSIATLGTKDEDKIDSERWRRPLEPQRGQQINRTYEITTSLLEELLQVVGEGHIPGA